MIRTKEVPGRLSQIEPPGRILREYHLPWDPHNLPSPVSPWPAPVLRVAGGRRRVFGRGVGTSFGRGVGINAIVRTNSASANCGVGRTRSGNSGGGSGPTSVGSMRNGNALVGNSNDRQPAIRRPRRHRPRCQLPRRTTSMAARGHAARKIPYHFACDRGVMNLVPTAGGFRSVTEDKPVDRQCVACWIANASGCGVELYEPRSCGTSLGGRRRTRRRRR